MAAAAALIAQGLGTSKAIQPADAEKVFNGFWWGSTYKQRKLDILAGNGAVVR